MEWSQDLSGRGRVCPEKALLRALASDGESDFDLYYSYFRAYKLAHSNANLLGNESRQNRAAKMARRKLFNPSRCDRPPAFFDLSSSAVRHFFSIFCFPFPSSSPLCQARNRIKFCLIFAGHQQTGPAGRLSPGLLLDGSDLSRIRGSPGAPASRFQEGL